VRTCRRTGRAASPSASNLDVSERRSAGPKSRAIVVNRLDAGGVWFALNEDRPLLAFAGIWTTFNGDRGTKSKPIPGPHQVYGFLTTAPNAIVAPIAELFT
jgi:putative SOS response-associated peptidase YedK